MGTIVEEATPAEKSPERKSDESEKVEEEKVTDEPKNEQETEPSSTRVQTSAKALSKVFLQIRNLYIHESQMASEVVLFIDMDMFMFMFLKCDNSQGCSHMVSIWIGTGQDEDLDMAPGRASSTVDPDAGGRPKKKAPGNVRISAWRLAKLNAQEASRAAAKARDKSSVLQKLGNRDPGNTPEIYYSSSSTVSSRSGVSMEYALQRSLQRASQKVLTPRGLPSLNPELSRIHVARVQGRSFEPGYVDSDVHSSISSHSITSTISESLSPLPAEIRYGPSENQFSNLGETMPSASSTSSTVLPSPGARMSWSGVHGPPEGRTHGPPRDVGVNIDAPNTGESLVRPSRERNIFLRDHRRSAVFWNRPGLGRFGGDSSAIIRPQSRILFGGSGISTSTFPSQVVRTWPKNPLAAHHPDESEMGTAGASASSNPTPTAALALSPGLPSQASTPESFSIFFGPPIVPVGAGKREALQPPLPSKPVTEPPRGGVHIQIAAQSRPFGQSAVPRSATPPRSVTPRSKSPTFVSRNKN